MERLSGLDAAFLYGETPSMHMHVLGLIVVDPATMPGGYAFSKIRDLILERSAGIPAMRRKLAPVPLNLSVPYWVEDGDFDVDYHVRRIAVPSPGGDRELADIVGDIGSRSLDRSRPLWEFWVVEGLENGHVAIVCKMHHSTVDGVTGANLLFLMFDLEPSPDAPKELPEVELLKEKPHTDLQLIGYAVLDRLRSPFATARLAGETVFRLGNLMLARRRREGPGMAAPFSAARTSFNAALTPHRTVAFVQVSLDDIKRVRAAFGTKVNDVVIAVCAGALRRYLADRDELPERPLMAAVPVGVHDETEDREGTNKVSFMFSTLATDIDDPVERLKFIAASNEGAKDEHSMIGASLLQQWADLATPNLFSLAARLYSNLNLADRGPVAHNLIISNVPGPPMPLYMAGARLVALYPLGPIMEGAGLNLTVLSNLDRVGFGFIACKELMPQLWELADAVPEALAELVKEADGIGPVPQKKPKRRAAKATSGDTAGH